MNKRNKGSACGEFTFSREAGQRAPKETNEGAAGVTQRKQDRMVRKGLLGNSDIGAEA